jgi:hypothetical protein
MLSAATMQRLAFIRYLYNVAAEQSRQPEPLAAASVLGFHDSVELFLQLACEHLGVPTKDRTHFMEYFDILAGNPPPSGLSQKASMLRLNKARVGLKHQGIMPAMAEVEGFRASTTTFFEENAPLVFAIQFGDVSMSNLVTCVGARTDLDEATRLMQEGNALGALDKIALAFTRLVDEYTGPDWFRSTPLLRFSAFSQYEFALPLLFGAPPRGEGQQDPAVRDFIDKAKRSFQAIDQALIILALGLDYPRYVRFRALTPSVSQPLFSPEATYTVGPRHSTVPPSPGDCRFCYEFVIASALRVQQLDSVLRNGTRSG